MYAPMVALVGLAVVCGYLLLTGTGSGETFWPKVTQCRHTHLSWPHAEWGHDGRKHVYQVCWDCSKRVEYRGELK